MFQWFLKKSTMQKELTKVKDKALQECDNEISVSMEG